MEWNNLKECLNEYTEFIEEAVKNKMPTYYELKDKIKFFLTINEYSFEICFSAPEYWKYANYGRKPGKFPPPNAIDTWITRRRITPKASRGGKIPSRPQLVYLISRKIAKEGFKGSGFLEMGLDEQKDYWEDRIASAVSADIENEMVSWLSPLMGETII